MIDQREYECAFYILDTDMVGFFNKPKIHARRMPLSIRLAKQWWEAGMDAGLSIFYTNRDGIITQEEFDGKTLAKSFSLRMFDPKQKWIDRLAGV